MESSAADASKGPPPCDVLFVGGAYVDVILHVSAYPAEDAKLRARQVVKRPGGNSMNSATVCSQLLSTVGKRCGVLTAVGGLTSEVKDILLPVVQRNGIAWFTVEHANLQHPTAWITCSDATKSRTIINHNVLPQLLLQDFVTACLCGGDINWAHFEGRTNTDSIREMMEHAQVRGITVSVEMERPNREGLEPLIALAHVIFFSNEFAAHFGRDQCAGSNVVEKSKNWLQQWALPRGRQGTRVFLTLGSLGAFAAQNIDEIHFQPALQVSAVDTIGAGDSFNAGAIFALSQGMPLPRALQLAVAVAGRKVAQHGFDGLWLPQKDHVHTCAG